MTATTCRVCFAPLPGTAVTCRSCTDSTLDDLRRLIGWVGHDGRRIPGLLADLIVTATRQDRMPANGTGSHGPARTSDPARLDALDLHRRATTAVTLAQRAVAEFGTSRLGQHPHADQLADTLSDYRARIERLVDRPDGAFTIPCPTCSSRVGIDVLADLIRCRCGEWGTPGWWTAHVAPTIPEPGATITGQDGVLWCAARHGIVVTEAQIRQWATRGKLPRAGRTKDGRTTYDCSALLALAQRMTSTIAAA